MEKLLGESSKKTSRGTTISHLFGSRVAHKSNNQEGMESFRRAMKWGTCSIAPKNLRGRYWVLGRLGVGRQGRGFAHDRLSQVRLGIYG